ncbi:MAG: N-acetylmuramoyl-L-alanine amidase [Clostridia bacterium]|nr:N-acetylmuramoyl-L-alanine amidase [Clostridia bacterium]
MAIKHVRLKLIYLWASIFFLFSLFFNAPSATAASYTVQPGDTLFFIGQRFGLSAQEIQAANGLTSSTIYPGQTLWVPNNGGITYIVHPGDTLFFIGQRFGLSVQEIKAANGLTSDYLYPGQRLWIPATVGQNASRGGSAREIASDLDLLAHLVYGEARGEPYVGQVAVAAVALNRVRSPFFPKTVAGVIFEPYAFTCVSDGQFYLQPNATAYQAAREAMAGRDPTGGALYYWNPVTATSPWVWSRTIITKIGNHVFAI